MSSSPSSLSSLSSSSHQVTLPTLSYSSYPIRRTSHRGSRLILSSTNQPLHLVHPSTFTPKAPDITIYTGPTTNTPVLGVCNFPSLSRNIVVGLGDPSTSNPNAIQWETLSKSSRDHSVYSFSLPALESPTCASTRSPDIDLNPTHRQTYTWRRTRHPHKYLNQTLNSTTTTTHTTSHPIHVPHSNLARRSWKLTSSTPTTTHSSPTPTQSETQQTQIHALFISTPAVLSPHNTGTLYIFSSSPPQPSPPQSPPSTPWILLTYSAISEKARRRALARRDLSWFF